MRRRLVPRRSVPQPIVELLRLCVVVFGAALGYQVALVIDVQDVGALDPLVIGVVLGSAVGYVIGGVLGRTTLTAVERTERALRDVSAEQIVAGVFGAVVGVVGGAAVAWPVFLLDRQVFAIPLFMFVLVTTGLLGYRVGSVRRSSMIGMFGAQAGMAGPSPSASVLPRLVDSSVAIDGRIVDVVRAGFLGGEMLVTQPVLDELQGLSDAGDDLRRAKGRRGLEVLEVLRREPGIDLRVIDDEAVAVPEVDAKLIRVALDRKCALLTLDTNLARSASLAGIKVLNLHALGLSMRPPVVAGDEVTVLLTKNGKEAGQAVGYLDDGTMVVVERARDAVGQDALVQVTSVLTTANGRLVFARPLSLAGHPVGAEG